jgi:uncharacterized protein (TIGR02118 family)
MHKLVILIESLPDQSAFDESWPQFLHAAEGMPGLISESTSRVDAFLFGSYPVSMVHELYFESAEQAREAMTSPQGRLAGRLLQAMTGGKVTLFLADHKQDNLENIRKHVTTGLPEDAANPGEMQASA